jgi:hypothetical protein
LFVHSLWRWFFLVFLAFTALREALEALAEMGAKG